MKWFEVLIWYDLLNIDQIIFFHVLKYQPLQSDLFWKVTFAGLKWPPFEESKGHFEEAGSNVAQFRLKSPYRVLVIVRVIA